MGARCRSTTTARWLFSGERHTALWYPPWYALGAEWALYSFRKAWVKTCGGAPRSTFRKWSRRVCQFYHIPEVSTILYAGKLLACLTTLVQNFTTTSSPQEFLEKLAMQVIYRTLPLV